MGKVIGYKDLKCGTPKENITDRVIGLKLLVDSRSDDGQQNTLAETVWDNTKYHTDSRLLKYKAYHTFGFPWISSYFSCTNSLGGRK